MSFLDIGHRTSRNYAIDKDETTHASTTHSKIKIHYKHGEDLTETARETSLETYYWTAINNLMKKSSSWDKYDVRNKTRTSSRTFKNIGFVTENVEQTPGLVYYRLGKT